MFLYLCYLVKLDALDYFYLNGFVTQRQPSMPSETDVGIIIVTQPPSRAEYSIKFLVNGRYDILQRVYENDRAAGITIHGRMFDRDNHCFIGILSDA